MVHYTIKLSQEESEELKKIIRKGSHTTQAFRAAYIISERKRDNSNNYN